MSPEMQEALPDAPGDSAGALKTADGPFKRAGAAVSGGLGAVSGLAPHMLHHVGPLAGAALLAGTAGTLLFGVIGFALTGPMLFRLHRRFGGWAAPSLALAIFVVMFAISTIWIGPAIRGDVSSPGLQPIDHDSHHGS
jgi:hypothetical protein